MTGCLCVQFVVFAVTFEICHSWEWEIWVVGGGVLFLLIPSDLEDEASSGSGPLGNANCKAPRVGSSQWPAFPQCHEATDFED